MVVIGTLRAHCGVCVLLNYLVRVRTERREIGFTDTHTNVYAELTDRVCLLLYSLKSCQGLLFAELVKCVFWALMVFDTLVGIY